MWTENQYKQGLYCVSFGGPNRLQEQSNFIKSMKWNFLFIHTSILGYCRNKAEGSKTHVGGLASLFI